MLFFLIALLGLISAGAAAVLFPARQGTTSWNAATLSACSPIWRTTTIYTGTLYPLPSTVTVTVFDHPNTVTIVNVDSASVSRQFSSMGAIDTIQVTQEVQEAPTGQPQLPDQTFSHTALAPVYEATEAPGNPSSAYYVPKPTTGPPQSTEVATTALTVTVLPLSAHPKVLGEINTTVTSKHTQTSIATSYAVWNTSANGVASSTGGYGVPGSLASVPWNTSVAGTGSSTGGYGFAVPPTVESAALTVTSTNYVDTVTTTNYVATSTVDNVGSSTANSKVPPGVSISGYGPAVTSAPDQPAKLVPRQTCTWVDAEGYGGWCNNWDGSTIVSYSTYNTTVYPQGTKTTQSDAPITPATVSPSPTQSQECGEVGPFVIDFDNLPSFGPLDNSTTLHPPVFNPFEHFWWGDCWTYAPPPNEPYPPHDGQHLAECIPSNNNTITGSPNAGLVAPTGFGAGPRNDIDAYWFDARSAWVACDNNATNINTTCEFNVTSWFWDGAVETQLYTDTYLIPPCAGNVNCRLHQIPFPGTYNGLTSLSFSATVGGEPRAFYMDSLHLKWFNNTCEAGLMRISSRKVRRGVLHV